MPMSDSKSPCGIDLGLIEKPEVTLESNITGTLGRRPQASSLLPADEQGQANHADQGSSDGESGALCTLGFNQQPKGAGRQQQRNQESQKEWTPTSTRRIRSRTPSTLQLVHGDFEKISAG